MGGRFKEETILDQIVPKTILHGQTHDLDFTAEQIEVRRKYLLLLESWLVKELRFSIISHKYIFWNVASCVGVTADSPLLHCKQVEIWMSCMKLFMLG